MSDRPGPAARRIPSLAAELSWVAVLSWAVQGVRLATLLVLARLLTPADFGQFALAAGVLTLLQTFAGQGLSAALVLIPKLEPGHVPSAIARAVLTGMAAIPFVIVVGLLMPAWADWRVIAALSPGLVAASLSAIALAVLRRERDFRRIAMIGVGCEIAGSLAGVIAALNHMGVWSLVVRQLGTVALTALVSVVLIRGALNALPSVRQARELSRLGRPVLAGHILVAARERLDEILVGWLFGPAALGLYSLARRYVEAVSGLIPAVIANRAWPVLASVRDNPAEFRRELGQSLRLTALFGWPAFLLIALLAPDWVPLLLGEQWTAMAPFVRILALIAAIRSIIGLNITALVAGSEHRLRLLLEAGLTIITLAALALAASWGAVVAAGVMAAAVVLAAPFELWVIGRVLPLSAKSQIGLFRDGAVLTLLAALWTVALMTILPKGLGPVAACALAIGGVGCVQLVLARRYVASLPR